MDPIEKCPQCAGEAVRRSSSALRHHFRRLTGSRKRSCLSCGRKWHIQSGVRAAGTRASPSVVIAFSVGAGLIFAIISSGSFNPFDWMRSRVLGPNAEMQGKLKGRKAIDGLFGSKGSADSDDQTTDAR